MRKKWSSEGPRKPQLNKEAQPSYRNHKRNSGSPLDTPDRWHLCCSKGLKRILLAQVERGIVKVLTFKRRPQKRRNAGAPLYAHATSRNKVAPKHLTNWRLIERTRKERCAMTFRTKVPNRHTQYFFQHTTGCPMRIRQYVSAGIATWLSRTTDAPGAPLTTV